MSGVHPPSFRPRCPGADAPGGPRGNHLLEVSRIRALDVRAGLWYKSVKISDDVSIDVEFGSCVLVVARRGIRLAGRTRTQVLDEIEIE